MDGIVLIEETGFLATEGLRFAEEDPCKKSAQ